MSLRVSVKPELFTWAMERANKEANQLKKKFKKLPEWIDGKSKPTLKQLEDFSKATYVPIGYFFLEVPPNEDIPIPDFRTINNVEITRPSPNLLETIYLCQQRQVWYQEFLRSEGKERVSFVGSIDKNTSVEKIAQDMRNYFDLDGKESNQSTRREEYLKFLVKKIRDQGIVVITNGVVGSNNHRKLDVNEFRGFTLCDDIAPLIFINGADSKSAQMFTLAHELAHIGLGKSALSNADLISRPSNSVEGWCNKLAAEFLVPLKKIKKEYVNNNLQKSIVHLTKKYKVSALVIIRRLLDAGHINRNKFEEIYKKELKESKRYSKNSGGDFYKTAEVRIGKRFAQDIIISALEGQTQFTEALDLLGITSMKTFDGMAKKLGIIS